VGDLVESLVIRNVKIPIQGSLIEGNILVENGLITSIGRRDYTGDVVLDGEGQLIVPGGIDLHAHVYDPEYLENEDWSTGSLAGAYGGLTTVIDMPLRVYVDNPSIVERKLSEARRHSYVNYGITGGFINKSNYKSISVLRSMGVKTFKFFTCRPFKIEDDSLIPALEEVKRNNAIAIFHAEDDDLISYGESKYRGINDIVAYHSSRTGLTEASAVLRVGLYALEVGARVHIAHLSSGMGLSAIKWLRENNVSITSEVCPHHLYFTREDSRRYGNYLKLAPTLKTREDIEELWVGLNKGLIDAYVSDNAPAPRSMKDVDTWSAWGGIPNLEIMGPFLYTMGVLTGRISLEVFIDVFSRNPAKILGVYPFIGELAIGSRADLYILETRRKRLISSRNHHHKVDWTPWEGFEFYGAPLHLVVGGKVVIEKGELVGEPGWGVYVGELVKEKV
jgi:dihydroorotase (multifunctional complex type)